MANENAKTHHISVNIPGLALLLIVGILSYRSGKKRGKEEYAEMFAKITNNIVEKTNSTN